MKAQRNRPAGEVNPFEAYLLIAVMAQGYQVLLGLAQPTSVRLVLPPLLLAIWAALLAGGGTAAVLGLFWPADPFTGVEIKRVGLLACAVGAAVYGGAAALLGAPGLAVATYNFLFAGACVKRVLQVSERLRQARDHLAEVRSESGG